MDSATVEQLLNAVRAVLMVNGARRASYLRIGFDDSEEEAIIPLPGPAVDPAAAGAGGRLRLRDLILSCLRDAGKPLKGAAIARRIGREYSGRIREVLGSMAREGAVLSGPDGYSLPPPSG